jgi:hypothetical protein
MCTVKGVDRVHRQITWETKSVQISASTETLHCDLSVGDKPSAKHLVRVTLLKKIYSDIKVTGRWITTQSLLHFTLTGNAIATTDGWTETQSVAPTSTSIQDFNSADIQRTGQLISIAKSIDIETKVEANPPWQSAQAIPPGQPLQWYLADVVGFAVRAMP